jgi:transposase InsO family protein
MSHRSRRAYDHRIKEQIIRAGDPAHPATWGKLLRERGWGRPRLRLYPAKPKVGLRTTAPNLAWHIDVTIIRLLDGTKAYVHAVIDNFSRKILAWTVAGRLDPMNTHEVLTRAAGNLPASRVGLARLHCDIGKRPPTAGSTFRRREFVESEACARAVARKLQSVNSFALLPRPSIPNPMRL